MPPAPENVRRGDIFWVRLDPTEGAEQAKTRPCLVVSNEAIHHMKIAIVVPLSSRNKPLRAHRINIPEAEKVMEPGTNGAPGDSLVLTHQIRCVSMDRFDDKRVAHVTPVALGAVGAALNYVLRLP